MPGSCILLLLTGSSVLHPGGHFFCAYVYYCVYTLTDTEDTHVIAKVIDHMATELLPNESRTLSFILCLSGEVALITE